MEDDTKPPHSFETATQAEVSTIALFERRFDLIQKSIEYADTFTSGQIKSGLFPYQVPAFLATVEFLRKHAANLNTTDQLTLSGYLDLPTSFGKTVIMAKLAQAFGIGKTPEGSMHRRRALVLVPSQDAIHQTIGDAEKGFRLHAPGLTVGAYYEREKNLNADVTVMTYASFLNFIKRIRAGEIDDPDFDVMLCDEAHHTLGSVIQEAIEEYRQGKIAIGLTATPEYDDAKTIKQIFAECIHKSELLPLIESGVLNGVQLIGLTTQNVIRTKGRGAFTDEELRPLMSDDERNLAIAEVAMRFIAEGRRGMINAIAGQKVAHAKLLANILDGQKVQRDDGTIITIRAEQISTFMKPGERKKILQEYAQGKIHVLTQVKALNESWDEDEVGFIINAAPTTSRLRAYQRIGRGMRPNGDWPITVIVELFDEIVGRKRAVTAWEIFGEDDFQQGKIITTPERRDRAERERNEWQKRMLGNGALDDQDIKRPRAKTTSPHTSAPRLTFDLGRLSEKLRARANDFTLRLSRELTIKPQEEIGPPKPGWIELISLEPIARQKGMGIFALRSAITREGGFACELALTSDGERYYVEPGAKKFALDYEPLEFASSGYWNASEMARKWHTTLQIIDTIIEGLKAEEKVKGQPKRSPKTKRKLTYYDAVERALIKLRVDAKKEEKPKEGENVDFLSEIAADTGVVRGVIQFFLVRHHGIVGADMRSPKTNKKGLAYSKEEGAVARFHFSHMEAPKNAVLLEQIAELTGLSEEEIRDFRERHKLHDALLQGRYADARGDYHYTLFCMPQRIEYVAQRLAAIKADEMQDDVTGVPASSAITVSAEKKEATVAPMPLRASSQAIDIMSLLREVRCNPAAAKYLLRQLPMADGSLRKGAHDELMIEPYAASLLRRRCRQIGGAPKTAKSDRYFANRFGCDLAEVHQVVTSLMPQPHQLGLFRTDDGDDIITFHYNAALSAQIEHVLRQRYGRPAQ